MKKHYVLIKDGYTMQELKNLLISAFQEGASGKYDGIVVEY